MQPFKRTLPKRIPIAGLPKVDWNHPLARGLIGCWLPGISKVDLTGNCPVLVEDAGVSGNFRSGKGVEGPIYGLDVPDATNSPILGAIAPPLYKSWSQLSMYYRGDRNSQNGLVGANSSTGHLPYYIMISYDNGIIDPYIVAGIGDSINCQAAQGVWNTAGTFTAGSTTSLDDVGTISVLATFKVGGNVVIYKNGASSTSNSFGASSPTSTAAARMSINGWSGTTRNSPTLCYLAYVWNRQLNAEEAILLDRNPYSFLMPTLQIPNFFVGTAGAAFLAAWARNSNLPVIGTGTY